MCLQVFLYVHIFPHAACVCTLRLVLRLFLGQENKTALCEFLCLVQEAGADPGAGGKRRVAAVRLCFVLVARLFSVFTVSRSKHRRCVFPLRLQQTPRSCRLLLSLCLQFRRPIITQHQPSSNYYPTHTHTHTHTQSIIISLYVTALNNKNYTP